MSMRVSVTKMIYKKRKKIWFIWTKINTEEMQRYENWDKADKK